MRLNWKTFFLPQFGKLRQNFSELADFVTIYIEEVSIVLKILIVAFVIAILMVRPTQPRGVTSVWEETMAIMTLILTTALRTGLIVAIR